MRLKKRYFLLPVLASLFVWLIYQTYAEVRANTIADFNGQQLTLARQAAQGLERFFFQYQNELNFLAGMPAILNLNQHGREVMHAYFVSRLEDIQAITRVSAQGRILYTVPVAPNAIGKDISGQEHVRAILNSRRSVVSEVFQAVQGYPAVALHVPVLRDGVFHGTLAILIPFKELAKRYVGNLNIGDFGEALLLSRQGIELYCPIPGHEGRNIRETSGEFPTLAAMARKMTTGREGTAVYVSDTLRGKPANREIRKQAAYTVVSLGGTYWALAVATPEREVLGTMQGFRNRLVLIVLLLVGVGGTYIYFGVKAWAIMREEKQSRNAALALKESEEKYRLLADLLPLAVFETDGDGVVTFANRIAFEKFELAPENFRKNLNALLAVAPEDRERARALLDTLFKGETVHGTEFQLITRGGRKFPGMVYVGAVFSGTEPAGMRGTIVDLTDIRGAQQALSEEEQKFRTLVEESPLGVSLIAPEGRFIYINPKFKEIFGYDLADLPDGEQWFKLAYPDRRQREAAMTAWKTDLSAAQVGEVRPRTFKVTCGDHTEKTINFRPVTLGSGDQFVTYEDITEKKRLEEQFQQAQRMEAIGTLAGGVAHDFNNLLMGIQGRTSLLLMDLSRDHPHYQSLKSIEAYVQSASDLTHQLLGYARGGKYEVKSTDLNQLIDSQNRMFGRTRKEITIKADFDQDLPAVDVDQGQMEQVLLNLYLNAWHAMPGGGELQVTTRRITLATAATEPFKVRPGAYVQVIIRDTGIGMDDLTLSKIFDPFFTTKDTGRGTGLGLASVYGIMQNHKGFVTVSSDKGRGTTFKLFVPVSSKPVQNRRATETQVVQGKETVLLVDDEDLIIDVGDSLLTALGYYVIAADSGQRAVALFEQMHPSIDLVLLDMIMPGMGGGEVYDRLTQINPDVKVILSSGYSIDGRAKAILDRGCDGFIQKPFGLETLSTKIREVLD